MALREYEYNGSTWQFDEAKAPAGAKPIDAGAKPKAKQAQLADKARSPRTK